MRPSRVAVTVLLAAGSGAEVRASQPSCFDRPASCESEAAVIRGSWRPLRDEVELERDATSAMHVTANTNPGALRDPDRALTDVLHAIETVVTEALVCGDRTDEGVQELERMTIAYADRGLPLRSDLRPIVERTASSAEECTRQH